MALDKGVYSIAKIEKAVKSAKFQVQRPIDISPSDNNAQKSYAEYPPDEQAVVYGDPHFMVTGETGERICFDFNPELGSNINLLSDPKSNLHVSGIISDETIKGKTFIHEIQFMSPEGGNLRFNPYGVFVKSFSLKETMRYDYKEPIRFMDILFTEHRNADGTREKITVEIDDGPKFLIKAKQSRGSMSFGIEDTTGLSDKTKGILGSFIHEGAFHVLNLHTKGENGEETAVVISQELEFSATKHDFHRNHDCWTIPEEEIAVLFTKEI